MAILSSGSGNGSKSSVVYSRGALCNLHAPNLLGVISRIHRHEGVQLKVNAFRWSRMSPTEPQCNECDFK